MADGKGCKCAAHSESECGCDADWTPQEVYDLRDEAALLRTRVTVLETAIRLIAERGATLSVCNGNVTVTMDGTLTYDEREVIEVCATHWQHAPAAKILRGLLTRLG